jgi:hypothetical protein
VGAVHRRDAVGARVIDELARELRAAGIPAHARRRILAEARDHLACAPDAHFGDPRRLAGEFAEELGRTASRRAALGSFAALAVAGITYAIAFWRLGAQPRDLEPQLLPAALAAIVLPQVSFVAGALAPLARSPRVAVRRALVGLVAEGGTLGALWALDPFSAWWLAPAAALLVVALAATVRAARIRVEAPARELALSWRFALVVAAAAALATAIAGSTGGDPIEGVRNAIVESLACLSGFAVLGRAIGLRR